MANSSAHRQAADLNSASPASIVFNQQRSPKSLHQPSNQFGHFRRSESTPSSANHHHHHQNHVVPALPSHGTGATSGSPSAHFKGHQRRQSVARLLPDISKLRLLSWLVEASNELINCDIAIMDGVYAKLNRSRESLLFWQHGASNQTVAMGNPGPIVTAAAANAMPRQATAATAPSRPPPPPSVQPVANRCVISQKQQQQQLKFNNKSSRGKLATTKHQLDTASAGGQRARTHYSLPSANYDAASLAAVSWRSSKTMPAGIGSELETDGGNKLLARNKQQQMRKHQQQERDTRAAGQPMQRHSCDATGSIGQQSQNITNWAQVVSVGNQGEDGDYGQQQQQQHVPLDQQQQLAVGDDCDSNQSDDDANSSTASSSTTSSGIHAASLSSESSSSKSSSSSSVGSFCFNSFDTPISGGGGGSSSGSGLGLLARSEQTIGCSSSVAGYPSSAAGSSSFGPSCNSIITSNNNINNNIINNNGNNTNMANYANSAEYLSERIRQTVMEHNYLQSLLVNIIRQHDRCRDLFNRQRRRQTSANSMDRPGLNLQHYHQSQHQMPRVDLADIADSLDDGCQCSCHLERRQQSFQSDSSSFKLISSSKMGNLSAAATPTSSSLNLFQSPAATTAATTPTTGSRKSTRRSKKIRGNSEPSREDMIQQLSDKLCENCFETHYWLQGCHSIKLTTKQKANKQQDPLANTSNLLSQQQSTINQSELNAIVALRNATFIKLVQQQVRSTISKSIELIDLIRKEIKSPESIKQKQLMRCFSSSIQLLSSVANYVVPSQDISSFIPEVEQQQQTSLFNLPPSDFDHLLLYPSSSSTVNAPFPTTFHINQTNGSATNYHLAAAPEIPPRRRQLIEVNQISDQSKKLSSKNSSSLPSHQRATNSSQFDSNIHMKRDELEIDKQEQTLSTNLQKLRTTDAGMDQGVVDSSSGASSNNSSASSSIARGQVQQSSLTRAPTIPSAILDTKPSHDHLSFETIASLSKHNPEEDLFGHTRPKFWQSSKFNFIKKLLHVKQQRLLRQQSKDRRIYNNKVQNKFRLVMMDLTHFNKSQQLLTTENGVNSLLTSMRNVLEFGLYLTLKLY